MSAAREPNTDRLTFQYHEARERVEKALSPHKPTAYSADGLTFTYEAPLSLPLPIGSYVEITADDVRYIGQVTSQNVVEIAGPEYGIKMDTKIGVVIAEGTASSHFIDRVRIPILSGKGILLARLDHYDVRITSEDDTFPKGEIKKATEETVDSYLVSTVRGQCTLEVGASFYGGTSARVELRAAGLIVIPFFVDNPDPERRSPSA